MPSGDLTVCVVGAGPRGLSVLERLCANERLHAGHRTLTIHLVDPFRPGPGQVWRSSQSRRLLMNTVASQVTAFTDDSVEMEGPVEPGPSLYAWAACGSAADPAWPAPAADFLAEARRLGPDDYPSRAFYGHYLEHVFERVVAGAPPQVTVAVHRELAVALDREGPDGTRTLTLADGTRLTGLEAVVLAQGHLPTLPTAAQAELARTADARGLTYLLPANPADLDLSAVKPGEALLLRGLGLNFFDYLALLTVGRGGEFVRTGGRLSYLRSGQEPRMFAGSRRGIPYHARGDNQKGPHGRYLPGLLTPQRIAELRRRTETGRPVYFTADLWPLIAREVECVYYGALLAAQGRGGERAGFVERFLAADRDHAADALLDEYRIAAGQRWSWDRIAAPHHGAVFADRGAFRDWLLRHLAEDVGAARAGNVSGPLKAALDVFRDLRNEVRLAVDHGGLEGHSYRDELQGWYTPLNAFLSIGPPASRIEELMALLEAGVVDLVGPGMRVRLDPDRPGYLAESAAVGGEAVRATALIEARLPEPDLRRTADPLLAHLLRTSQCRTHRMDTALGGGYETGGLAVTGRPYRVIDASGRADPRLFAYGVPTETVHWVTAAGIRPGVNSVTLGDSDAIARAVLGVPARPRGVLLPRSERNHDMTTGQNAVDLDAGLLSPVRAGTPVEAAVSDHAWLQAMLDAEAALARAQAALGTLPGFAAEAITRCARAELLDLRALSLAARETANPVVGLVAALTEVVARTDPKAAPYVHRGSTSQDVLDTGMMLVCARALTIVRADLGLTARALGELAGQHRDTLMAGRTLTLHAVPTTFGLKAAGWRDLVLDAAQRIDRLLAGGLPVSLGGAAGTLAGYLEYASLEATDGALEPGDFTDRLSAAYAAETGLAVPGLPWHALRAPIADLAAALGFTVGAVGKIAVDVQSLTRTEVGEVSEAAVAGRGSSSAMPHKRNPVLATLIRSAALQVPCMAMGLTQCLVTEDERSAGVWHAEWLLLRECLRLTGGAVHTAVELSQGLVVRPERMAANVGLTGSRVVSERLVPVLAPHLGKARARQLLTEASGTADATGRPLADVLAEVADVAEHLDAEALAALLDPAGYTGAAGPLVDRARRRSS